MNVVFLYLLFIFFGSPVSESRIRFTYIIHKTLAAMAGLHQIYDIVKQNGARRNACDDFVDMTEFLIARPSHFCGNVLSLKRFAFVKGRETFNKSPFMDTLTDID